MSNEIKLQVQKTILKLERAINSQNELDRLWSEVEGLLLNELSSLPDLPSCNSKKPKNQFIKSQPFWNPNLESAWKDVCHSEREYLNYKANINCQIVYKK